MASSISLTTPTGSVGSQYVQVSTTEHGMRARRAMGSDANGTVGPSVNCANDTTTTTTNTRTFVDHKALRVWNISMEVTELMFLSIFSLTISFLVTSTTLKIVESEFPRLRDQVLLVCALVLFLMLVMILIMVKHTTLRKEQQSTIQHDPILGHLVGGGGMNPTDIIQSDNE